MKKSECTFNQHSSRLEKLQLDECWLKLCCIHVPRVFPTHLLLKFSCQRFLGSFMSACYQFLPWIISMIPELPALLHFESPHLKPPFISTQLSRQCKALTQTELVAKTQAPFVFLWRPWRRTSALLSSQCQPTCMIEDTVWSSRHLCSNCGNWNNSLWASLSSKHCFLTWLQNVRSIVVITTCTSTYWTYVRCLAPLCRYHQHREWVPRRKMGGIGESQ